MIRTMAIVEEQATGCVQRGPSYGPLYAGPINRAGHTSSPGTLVDVEAAKVHLREGGRIDVPNAGASSYRSVFPDLGFDQVVRLESSSSAGDWTLGVRQGQIWYLAFQENRYPGHGFGYSVHWGRPADSQEELERMF